MSVESKQLWREQNPERYAAYERVRARARRRGYWGERTFGGGTPRKCESSESYYRYEWSGKRMLEKMNHARWGADWRRMIKLPPKEQLRAARESAGLDVASESVGLDFERIALMLGIDA